MSGLIGTMTACKVCTAAPALTRAALAGDENAETELVNTLVDWWQEGNPDSEITKFVRSVARSSVVAVLEQMSVVDRLALLSECRVEQEQEGP